MTGTGVTPFDHPDHYLPITRARLACLRRLVPEIRTSVDLGTAVDVGCGVGYFSEALRDVGLQVIGVDARETNVSEARRRHPDIDFVVSDIESDPLHLQPVDLVLAFGLLYHLENPFRAVRHLATVTAEVLIVETRVAPDVAPILLFRDDPSGDDQALRGAAFYPSAAALVVMLQRSGFEHVYELSDLPAHPEFRARPWRRRARTIVVASRHPLDVPTLTPAAVEGVRDPYLRRWASPLRAVRRLVRDLRR